MWDLSLVDPDNRRPVDYGLRSAALDALLRKSKNESPMAVCHELTSTLDDGRIKLWTTHRALGLRNRRPDLFRRGDYLPLSADERHREHVIAFLRRHGRERMLVAVPRFACTLMHLRPELPLGRGWGNAELIAEQCAGERLVNVFTGAELLVPRDGRIPLAKLFADFPVAMLESRPD
jgi:(1->4)-alpha-D-glucan 1-alpha-D-glucosylmutase